MSAMSITCVRSVVPAALNSTSGPAVVKTTLHFTRTSWLALSMASIVGS